MPLVESIALTSAKAENQVSSVGTGNDSTIAANSNAVKNLDLQIALIKPSSKTPANLLLKGSSRCYVNIKVYLGL